MEKLNKIISLNLKKIRKEKELSLDKLAKLTGVSKSMLSQIERGEVNPTVTTLWKIALGLKISSSALMREEEKDIVLVKKDELNPISEEDNKTRVYSIFPFDEEKKFEIYLVEIEPGKNMSTEPHTKGTSEFITVLEGSLIMHIEGKSFQLKSGDSIKFKADVVHSYENNGEDLLKLNTTIYYSDK